MWGRDATAMISASSDAPSLQTSGFTYIPNSMRFGQFATADISVLKELADGRILALGSAAESAWSGGMNARATALKQDGTFDLNFGTQGSLMWGVESGTDVVIDAEQARDGSIFVLSKIYLQLPKLGTTTAISRITADGRLDPGFATGGVLVLVPEDLGVDVIDPMDIAVSSDGSLTVAGTLSDAVQSDPMSVRYTNQRLVQMRFTPDGSPDSSFNGNGRLVGQPALLGDLIDVDILPDLNLAVTTTSGYLYSGPSALRRYTFSPQLSNASEWSQTELLEAAGRTPYGGLGGIRAFQLLPDNRQVMVVDNNGRHWLQRFLANGLPDSTFNDGAALELPNVGDATWVSGLRIAADGSYLVDGRIERNSEPTLINQYSRFILHATASGKLDQAFGPADGLVEIRARDVGAEALRAILPLSSGEILWSGQLPKSAVNDFSPPPYNDEVRYRIPLVGRLTQSGAPDASFGGEPPVETVQSYENANPSSPLNLFLKPFEPDGNYSGSTVSISRSGGASPDDSFVPLGNLVFGEAGTLSLDGVAMGTASLKSGELTLAFGENAKRESVDAVLARIGYRYDGDSPPPNATDLINPELTLAWRYTNSNGSATTHLQTIRVAMANDPAVGSILITGSFVEGQTLTFKSDLTDPDGPLSFRYYFWYANDQIVPTPIGSGVESPQLTLGPNEVGKTISLRVAAFDHFGARAEFTTQSGEVVKPADRTPPSIIVGSDKTALKLGDTANLTFTLSEPSTDFTASDVVVRGGSLIAFTGAATQYAATFKLESNVSDPVLLSVPSGSFADPQGNANVDGDDADNAFRVSAQVSGNILHWRSGSSVSDARVTLQRTNEGLQDGVDEQGFTDGTGAWKVQGLEFERFTITAAKPLSKHDQQSITAADVLSALKLATGRYAAGEETSRYQFIAADLTGDQIVALDDVQALLRIALGVGDRHSARWTFLEEGAPLEQSQDRIVVPAIVERAFQVDTHSNWVAVLVGDVDGNWSAPLSTAGWY